jgi:hypothetical protein
LCQGAGEAFDEDLTKAEASERIEEPQRHPGRRFGARLVQIRRRDPVTLLPSGPTSILDALKRFDRELRGSPEWAGWDQSQNHKYAIAHDGRRCPVKQIVRMATDATYFSGGLGANGYVENLGFTVAPPRVSGDWRLRDAFEAILRDYTAPRLTQP